MRLFFLNCCDECAEGGGNEGNGMESGFVKGNLPLSLPDRRNGVNHNSFPTWNPWVVKMPFQNLLFLYYSSHQVINFQVLDHDG